jgi:hypothetical protein
LSFRSLALSLAGVAAGVVATACGGNGDEPSMKVFVAPTWDGAETFTYDLDQEGVDNEVTCVLSTEPSTEEQTVLSRACADNRGYRDDGTVLVESGTLRPLESTRVIFDVEDNETTEHSIVYEGGEAVFETRSGDDSRTTTRDLPTPTAESPDPGWYDDESLFWLVRGIDLREGYEGHYTHVINAGQPRVLTASIEVEGLEEVEVPAGTFNAWLVRVRSGNVVYRIWVDEGEERWVVRAQIEGSTYELRGAE